MLSTELIQFVGGQRGAAAIDAGGDEDLRALGRQLAEPVVDAAQRIAGVSLFLLLFANLGAVKTVACYSLITLLIGIVLALWGSRVLRLVLFPISSFRRQTR